MDFRITPDQRTKEPNPDVAWQVIWIGLLALALTVFLIAWKATHDDVCPEGMHAATQRGPHGTIQDFPTIVCVYDDPTMER